MRLVALIVAFSLAVVATCTLGVAGHGMAVCVGILVVVCIAAEVVHCLEQEFAAMDAADQEEFNRGGGL